MRTMAEEPLLPSFSAPVTDKRWGVARFGTTLDAVRVILLLGENERMFFYSVEGNKGPEVRGISKRDIQGRFDAKEDADIAIGRAKLAWDEHAAPVKKARDAARKAIAERDDAWRKALNGETVNA